MNWRGIVKRVLFDSEGVMDKYIAIATRIINDAYHKRTVYSLEYFNCYTAKDIQHVKVRRLLSKYGYLDWDDYNRMWHSFRINANGVEFVESKEVLAYDKKFRLIDLLSTLFILFVLTMICWFLYIVVNVIVHLF